jgi:hypothetical protein
VYWIGACTGASGQCIGQYGPGEAYLPVLEVLGRMGRDSLNESVFADRLHVHTTAALLQL